MSNNSTSLYTTSTSTGKVSSNNFTTLYTKPVEITATKNYGNSNVANFLLAGTDGANTITGITDEGFLTVYGVTNLGNVGNVHITGGNSGYVLATDGSGNLQFIAPSSLGADNIPYIHFDVIANGNNQQFTTSDVTYFESNNFINLFKNGVNLEPTLFEKINANTIQVNIPLTVGDTIDILATNTGGNGLPAGSTYEVQFNGGYSFSASNNFTFNTSSNTLSTPNLTVSNVATFGDVSNVHISGGTSGQLLSTDGNGNLSWTSFTITEANYANFAGTAFSVSGSNVTGTVANSNHASSADVANSISGSNVVGTVSDSTHALISDSANNVAGANVIGYVANATHANISDNANIAYSVSASNIVGTVANATYSVTSGTTNSVNIANVSGIGNIATINLNGNGSTMLLGNGVWGSTGFVANANYANFAGNAISVSGANVTGQVANSLVASTVYSNSQPNITFLGTLTALTVQGMTSIQEAKEKFVANNTAATGTVNFDVVTSAIILQTTNASANFTLNIRGNTLVSLNSMFNSNESISLTYINKNGASGYYANVIQIDGTPVTPVWINGTSPSSGTINGYDVYNFNILKTASATYAVFGVVGSYQ